MNFFECKDITIEDEDDNEQSIQKSESPFEFKPEKKENG